MFGLSDKEISKIRSESKSLTYDEANLEFITNYSRMNPVTKREATREWVRALRKLVPSMISNLEKVTSDTTQILIRLGENTIKTSQMSILERRFQSHSIKLNIPSLGPNEETIISNLDNPQRPRFFTTEFKPEKSFVDKNDQHYIMGTLYNDMYLNTDGSEDEYDPDNDPINIYALTSRKLNSNFKYAGINYEVESTNDRIGKMYNILSNDQDNANRSVNDPIHSVKTNRNNAEKSNIDNFLRKGPRFLKTVQDIKNSQIGHDKNLCSVEKILQFDKIMSESSIKNKIESKFDFKGSWKDLEDCNNIKNETDPKDGNYGNKTYIDTTPEDVEYIIQDLEDEPNAFIVSSNHFFFEDQPKPSTVRTNLSNLEDIHKRKLGTIIEDPHEDQTLTMKITLENSLKGNMEPITFNNYINESTDSPNLKESLPNKNLSHFKLMKLQYSRSLELKKIEDVDIDSPEFN